MKKIIRTFSIIIPLLISCIMILYTTNILAKGITKDTSIDYLKCFDELNPSKYKNIKITTVLDNSENNENYPLTTITQYVFNGDKITTYEIKNNKVSVINKGFSKYVSNKENKWYKTFSAEDIGEYIEVDTSGKIELINNDYDSIKLIGEQEIDNKKCGVIELTTRKSPFSKRSTYYKLDNNNIVEIAEGESPVYVDENGNTTQLTDDMIIDTKYNVYIDSKNGGLVGVDYTDILSKEKYSIRYNTIDALEFPKELEKSKSISNDETIKVLFSLFNDILDK